MGCAVTKKTTPHLEIAESVHPKEKNQILTLNDLKVSSTGPIIIEFGTMAKDYIISKHKISESSRGEIKQVVHRKTNILRAAKIIKKSSTDKIDKEKLEKDLTVLKKIDHLNVIKIFECYEDENNYIIITELCTGGTLLDRMLQKTNTIDEKSFANTIKQILSAMSYCNKYGINHRKLKPENILYDTMKPDAPLKIINFGISQIFRPDEIKDQNIGPYMAPEVLKGEFSHKSDVWACGAILYAYLSADQTFNMENILELTKKLKKGSIEFKEESWSHVSANAINFMKKILDSNQKTRYTAQQALNDPWFLKMTEHYILYSDKRSSLITLNNLKTIRFEKKLQEAAWMFLVTYLTTKEQKVELMKTFQAFDTNNDGMLSREELIRGYKLIMKSNHPEDEVDELLASVDFNKNGSLDYSEFVMATINREKLLGKERLEAAFKMFDQDGNGYIDISEIKALFQSNQYSMVADDVWVALMSEVDQNSDGKISLTEFKQMMLQMLHQYAICIL